MKRNIRKASNGRLSVAVTIIVFAVVFIVSAEVWADTESDKKSSAGKDCFRIVERVGQN